MTTPSTEKKPDDTVISPATEELPIPLPVSDSIENNKTGAEEKKESTHLRESNTDETSHDSLKDPAAQRREAVPQPEQSTSENNRKIPEEFTPEKSTSLPSSMPLPENGEVQRESSPQSDTQPINIGMLVLSLVTCFMGTGLIVVPFLLKILSPAVIPLGFLIAFSFALLIIAFTLGKKKK